MHGMLACAWGQQDTSAILVGEDEDSAIGRVKIPSSASLNARIWNSEGSEGDIPVLVRAARVLRLCMNQSHHSTNGPCTSIDKLKKRRKRARDSAVLHVLYTSTRDCTYSMSR